MRSLIALAILIASTTHAAADNPDPIVGAGDNAFFGGASDVTHGVSSNQPSSSVTPIGTYHQQPACTNICAGNLLCADGSIKTYSWLEAPDGRTVWESYWCPSQGGAPAVTDDLIAIAFQRVPLPPSTLSIQPVGGQTLVNFDTNFFTDQDLTLDRTVRLLGQRVDLRIEAHSYTWRFGDGQTITTSNPGAPYPRLQITHNYLQTGDYRPALDTTWVADYRVNGGPWRAVPGSVTIEGAPADLSAIEARPTLVGYGG